MSINYTTQKISVEHLTLKIVRDNLTAPEQSLYGWTCLEVIVNGNIVDTPNQLIGNMGLSKNIEHKIMKLLL